MKTMIECMDVNGDRVFLNPDYVVRICHKGTWEWFAEVDGEEGVCYILATTKKDAGFKPVEVPWQAFIDVEGRNVK